MAAAGLFSACHRHNADHADSIPEIDVALAVEDSVTIHKTYPGTLIAKRSWVAVVTWPSKGARTVQYDSEVRAVCRAAWAVLIDTSTGTMKVQGMIDNPDGELRSGMYATVELPQGTEPHAVLIVER